MAGSKAPAEQGASPYVSRGGVKLAAALDAFRLDVTGVRALDAGASTGGFTDCLLKRGAARVIAVDVAYGQLAWTLRNDERVSVMERTNVRALDLGDAGEHPVDIVVADLSFISLGAVRDALIGASTEDADLVLMVKPQFEAPSRLVERGGVVRDPALWRETMLAVAGTYRERGCALDGATPSPLTGPAGNREFFLHFRRGSGVTDAGDVVVDRAIEEAP
jgi:23S rRNA (cytidine1920-2'-O)/16S rRNA (cytidine1409-2'-O)-methyltransferase